MNSNEIFILHKVISFLMLAIKIPNIDHHVTRLSYILSNNVKLFILTK